MAIKGQTSGRKEVGLRSCHCLFLPHSYPHPCTCAFQQGWPLGQGLAWPGLAWVLPFHCPGSPVFLPTHTVAHASLK